MFGDDRFHPSAEGYRAAANAVLPTALEALGLAAPGATGFPVPLHDAAALAANGPGTAVQPGRRVGPDPQVREPVPTAIGPGHGCAKRRFRRTLPVGGACVLRLSRRETP
jgi:hypothetical protein